MLSKIDVKKVDVSRVNRIYNVFSSSILRRRSSKIWVQPQIKVPTTPTPATTSYTQRNRKRKIIWFNPPYDKNLTTNIGKLFFHLIQTHFPKKHKFHKIFNKNNIKLSYSCMPNINTIINSHNNKIINPPTPPTEQRTCNCMKKEQCPVNQNCLASNIVYEAMITCTYKLRHEKVFVKQLSKNASHSTRHHLYTKSTKAVRPCQWSLGESKS